MLLDAGGIAVKAAVLRKANNVLVSNKESSPLGCLSTTSWRDPHEHRPFRTRFEAIKSMCKVSCLYLYPPQRALKDRLW